MAITRLNNNSITSITALPSAVAVENQPAFLATRGLSGSEQTLSDDVNAKMQCNDEVYDTDNCYDNSTNYRFTPNVAGKYFVYTSTRFESNTNSAIANMSIDIIKNGDTSNPTLRSSNNLNVQYIRGTAEGVCGVVDMNGTTDYIEVYVQCNVTTGSSIGMSPFNNTIFGAYKLI